MPAQRFGDFGIAAEPRLEAGPGLMEEHAQPVDGGMTALTRRPKQPGFERRVNDVVDDRLARQLIASGLRAAAIHADRSQKDRTAAIESFRAGRTKILVATDVAARGLDIDSVGLIVNYEVPHTLDTYVHRVGRTGRYDATGHALTLAEPSDRHDLQQIEQAFGLKLLTYVTTSI